MVPCVTVTTVLASVADEALAASVTVRAKVVEVLGPAAVGVGWNATVPNAVESACAEVACSV